MDVCFLAWRLFYLDHPKYVFFIQGDPYSTNGNCLRGVDGHWSGWHSHHWHSFLQGTSSYLEDFLFKHPDPIYYRTKICQLNDHVQLVVQASE